LPLPLLPRIADALPHMLWIARADGSIEFVNARIAEYTGMSRERLRGGGWRETVHPDERGRALASWRRAIRTGEGFRSDHRIRRADGKYRWHLCSVEPLRGAGGRAALWCGTAIDIDDRRRAEERLKKVRRELESLVAMRTRALEESGRRLREFLDRMPAIAWIKDPGFRYVWISESFTRVLRRTRDELLGRDSSSIFPADMARRTRRDDEQALRVNGPVQSIYTVPLPGNARRRMLSLRFPFPDEQGALGIAGIAMELPEAWQADDAGEGETLLDRLSARERQVLQLTVEGLTAAEAGARLNLSRKSVETYRSRLMAKLGLQDTASLVKFAIRYGLTGTR
jgi:PAS domain S-box-containing protein